MTRRFDVLSRLATALIMTLAAGLQLTLAHAADAPATTVQISVDAPSDGATVANGSQLDIGGWAADTAGLSSGSVATAPGVDRVDIYVDGPQDGGGKLVGSAAYGKSRPDVGTVLGSAAYANSGFDFIWTLEGITPGSHTLYVYAHSAASGWSSQTLTIQVQNQPTTASDSTTSQSGQSEYVQSNNMTVGGGAGYAGGGTPLASYYAPGGNPSMMAGGMSNAMGVGAQAYGAQAYGGYAAASPYTAASAYTAGVASPYASAYSYQPSPAVSASAYGVPYALSVSNPYPQAYASSYSYPYVPSFPVASPPPTGYTSALSAPTGLAVVGAHGTTALLTWNAVPGAAGYRVLQSVGNASPPVPASASNVTPTSAVVSGLSPNTPYAFQVVALDSMGQQSAPSAATTVVIPPGA